VDIAPGYFESVFQFFKPHALVAPRKIGSSSYSKSGLAPDPGVEFQEYLPSVMNFEALFRGLTRGTLPGTIAHFDMMRDMSAIFHYKFGPFLIGSKVSTLSEVLSSMELTTSPGWPYCYFHSTKLEALMGEWRHVLKVIKRMFKGKEVHMLTQLTLKDELLSALKVEGKRSRIFSNVSLPVNLVGAILFNDQNNKMHESLFQHPNTIGVDLPGPGFLNIYTKLSAFVKDPNKKVGWDDDASSWDILFLQILIYVIMDGRMKYLPDWTRQAVYRYYAEVYAGYRVVLGRVLRFWMDPSGHLNTADDNSIGKYLCYYIPFKTMNPNAHWKDFCRALSIFSNGDDGVGVRVDETINWHPVAMVEILATWGVYLEITSYDLKPVRELVYLSHTLVRRYVRFAKMWIWVAGGRRDKMIAGLRWKHKHDDAVSMGRFYALVNALWPWEDVYQRCLKTVDDWVASHPRNRVNDDAWVLAKRTRKTEEELFFINTGLRF